MKRAFVAGAILALSALFGPVAKAEEPVLIGLFEGHGIAPPADPARARAAIAMAQRIHDLCGSLYQHRAGGTGVAGRPCAVTKGVAASLGRDAAAALLDILDEPRKMGSMRDNFIELVGALADTGREDVVPILIRAMERMDARKELHDPRVAEFGWSWRDAMDSALIRLTYLERYERAWSMGSSTDLLSRAAAGWRSFWEANKHKSRATWKAESIARARESFAKRVGEDALEPALTLTQHAETKREGIAALRRLVRSDACKGRCERARDALLVLEGRDGRRSLSR